MDINELITIVKNKLLFALTIDGFSFWYIIPIGAPPTPTIVPRIPEAVPAKK